MATKKTGNQDPKAKAKNANDDKASPPWKKDAPAADEDDDVDDEDEDEDEDEEASDDDEDAEDEASDEDEEASDEDEDEDEEASDEDEDDADEEDEEDEEEDEEDAPPAKAQVAKARAVRHPRDEEDEEDDDEDATDNDDWIPDWAPWAVMLTLIAVGLLGALGVFSPSTESAAHAVPSAEPDGSAQAANDPAAPAQIGASHVLIAYKGAMRAAPSITRTKEEAQKLAREVLVKARRGADFAALAREYSDDPTAKQRGGDLGMFGRTQMVKPFADAAFALPVNQIGGPVESPFGYHIIKRTK